MIIPVEQVPADTLTAIIEHYVLREGTDYGEQELYLAEKVEQVRRQLISKEVVLVWSELHESLNIMPARDFIDESEFGS
ncbi:YheU family protein [Gallaecimonas sp. GXIMD4217]|uniref:YheU family protein n=1 Tax=Gallaecimonas sp. GXIMD4217 TaxID=3131927 RepID=UPI00311B161A